MTFVRHLPYTIESVWAAITEPAQRAAWFGTTTIDGRAGGSIEMVPTDPPAPTDKKRMSGRILVWEPPHVLEHEWHQDIVGDGAVRYDLARDGADTALTEMCLLRAGSPLHGTPNRPEASRYFPPA